MNNMVMWCMECKAWKHFMFLKSTEELICNCNKKILYYQRDDGTAFTFDFKDGEKVGRE